MTPEAAVEQLAEIVAPQSVFTEDDVYAAMSAAGMPDRVADVAYKFTQVAWGRVALDRMGIQFSPDYFCFSGTGQIVESGRLAEQPYFVAAMARANAYAKTPGFVRLAFMASDAHAVNDALKAGSKPENVVTAPVALFLEATSSEGIEAARRILTDHLSASAPRLPGQPQNQTLQRTVAAGKVSWLQRLFGRGPGR